MFRKESLKDSIGERKEKVPFLAPKKLQVNDSKNAKAKSLTIFLYFSD